MIGVHASEQRQAIRTWRFARVKGHYPRRVVNRPQRCETRRTTWTALISTRSRRKPAPGSRLPPMPLRRRGPTTRSPSPTISPRGGGCACARACSTTSPRSIPASASSGSGAILRSWSPRSGAISCFIPKASGPPRAARPRPAPSSFCRPHRRSASKRWRGEPGSAPRWFQLYLPPERALAENLIDRAAAAGFRAIVLTVDQPVYGSSPRAARAPLAASPDIRNANLPGQPIAQHSYKAGHTGR